MNRKKEAWAWETNNNSNVLEDLEQSGKETVSSEDFAAAGKTIKKAGSNLKWLIAPGVREQLEKTRAAIATEKAKIELFKLQKQLEELRERNKGLEKPRFNLDFLKPKPKGPKIEDLE